MKTLITLALVLALSAAPIQESKANILVGVCLIVLVTVVASGVAIKVKSCGPKWYCLEGGDPITKFSLPITMREIQMEGYKILCGPYDSRQKLIDDCAPCRLIPQGLNVQNQLAAQMVTLQVERSTNLVNWDVVATQEVDANNFEFDFTEPSSARQVYYRAWFATQ